MATQKAQRNQIEDGAVNSEHFAAGAVDATAIAADAVDGSKIADDAIDSEHIADDAIDGAHLSNDAITTVTDSLLFIEPVASGDRSSPGANFETVTSDPEWGFNSTAGVVASGTTEGYPVLLENPSGGAGAHHFNTTASTPNANSDEDDYKANVYDSNGGEIVDGSGNRVWAVLTVATARSAGNTTKLRFFSGEFGPSATAYTMSQAYFLAYPKLSKMTNLSRTALRNESVKMSKTAAGVLGGSIGTAELEDGAVTSDKLADDAVTSDKIADDAVTGDKLADDTVTEAKLHADVLLRGVNLGPQYLSSFGGVVYGAGTECAVAALASPGMAVRVQVGGTVYGTTGKRSVAGTTTSLSIGAADGSNPRYDAIVVNSSGAYAVRPGTPGSSPTAPSLTAGDTLLAYVKVAANVTEIGSADIFDHRRWANPTSRYARQTANGSATAWTLTGFRSDGTVQMSRQGFGAIPVSSNPSGMDEYTVTNPVESQGTVITVGSAPTNGNNLIFHFRG